MPYCPVSKKNTEGTKQSATEILEVNTDDKEAEIVSFGSKYGKVPKTRVHLRYYKIPEYHCLSDEEKDDLWEWRKTHNSDENNPKSNKGKLGYKSTYKAIASSIERKVEEKIKAIAYGNTK